MDVCSTLHAKLFRWFSVRALFILLIVAGCATPPKLVPAPWLNPILWEHETTITGTGIPHAQVNIWVKGLPIAKDTISPNGTFEATVTPLGEGQVLTATQIINEQISIRSAPVSVKKVRLSGIEIDPVISMTIEEDQSFSYTVRGIFSNGKTEEPLPEVTWVTSEPTVATIDPDGVVTGLEAGITSIQAMRDGTHSTRAQLIVKPRPPVVTSSLSAGDTIIRGTASPSASIKLMLNGIPLRTGVPTDAHGQWQVSDLPLLNEYDQVTSTQIANSIQSVTSLPTIVGPAALTELSVSPTPSVTVQQGQIQHFTASGSFSNGKREQPMSKVIWQTENPRIASVEVGGIVTGIRAGATAIRATRGDKFSQQTTVIVKPPPPTLVGSLKAGDTTIRGTGHPLADIQLIVNGESRGSPIQSNSEGESTLNTSIPLAENDEVTITQMVNNIQSTPSSPIHVGPAVLTHIVLHPPLSDTVDIGHAQQVTATGTFSDGRIEDPLPNITWQLANPSVATIDAEGVLTGIAAGTTAFHAARGDIRSDPLELTVQPPPPVVTSSLKAGDTIVAGSAAPAARIRILRNGIPLDTHVLANAQGQWQAQDVPSLNEDDEISSAQVVNAIQSAPSAAVIVAPAVLTKIEIQPAPTITVQQGQTQQFTASGVYSDGHIESPLAEVTWQSENPNVAKIQEEGLVTGNVIGTTKIRAKLKGTQSPHATLTVQPKPPVVTSPLKAGSTIIAGAAYSSADIQILMNGVPLEEMVKADSQGHWQVNDLPFLNENDEVTATQVINEVRSDLSKVVKVLANNLPLWGPIGDQVVTVGETLKMTLNATDPDGDALSFEAIGQPLPTNSTLDKGTGLFTFTPTKDQVGESTLSFLVSDGIGTQTQTVSIKVSLPKSVVALLSNPDGTVGSIEVANPMGSQVLDKAGQAISLGSPDKPLPKPFLLKEEDILETFKDALKANPEKPLKYLLYFEKGTKLSPDSKQELQRIPLVIAGRSNPDVSIIGHSDRAGSDELNYKVSLNRANSIRDALIESGIASQIMEVTSHGEHNPVVKTQDGVKEPLNRRVEIIIR